MTNLTIGFIGQGWIGRNYADDFERRGYSIVRYSLEPEYSMYRNDVGHCDIVFVAVPTPTNEEGFDSSILEAVLSLVGEGKIAVVKSTVIPGTTERLQSMFPDRIVVTSPEFLREAHAAHDAAHPIRNLIGIPDDTERHRSAAKKVLDVLPKAPYTHVMPARAAELVKYAGNVFLALKVVYANLLFDLCGEIGLSYEDMREVLAEDPRIGPSHLSPVDASRPGSASGRGAGGHCFIKDLEAFRLLYEKEARDPVGDSLLTAIVRKNNALLTASNKDLELLEAVYGKQSDLLP